MTLQEKIDVTVAVINEKKGFDLQLLEVAAITQVADAFLICQAKNRTQSQSIADEIMEKLKDGDERPLRVEGYREGGWILMDYNDLIIHIFLPEEREYYDLPRLWKDAVFTRYDEDGVAHPVGDEDEKA